MVIYECVTGWRPFHSENFKDPNKYSAYVSKKKKEDIREYTDGGMNTNMFITILLIDNLGKLILHMVNMKIQANNISLMNYLQSTIYISRFKQQYRKCISA